jgi:hypothetical protein
MNSGPEMHQVVYTRKATMLPYRGLPVGGGITKSAAFKMDPVSYGISNLPILSLAPYLASVDMFDERDKITAYLEFG